MKHLLIVGNGMVSQRFVEYLIELETPFQITIVGEESFMPYDRVHLANLFNTNDINEISLTDESFYKDYGIKNYLGNKVKKIDENKATLDNGELLEFDVLVYATGASSFIPSIKGVDDSSYIFTYRDIKDLELIKKKASVSKTCTIIGGGVLGIEAAYSLREKGLEVSIVELSSHPMHHQLDAASADILSSHLKKMNISMHTGKCIQEIIETDSGSQKVVWEDGGIESDFIVLTTGIKARDELARQSGVHVLDSSGIIIDENCQTNKENVYAIGDCAAYRGQLTGLIAPGYYMARALASHLADEPFNFNLPLPVTLLKIPTLKLASVGDIKKGPETRLLSIKKDAKNSSYKKVLTNKARDKVQGGIFIGDVVDYSMINLLHEGDSEVSDINSLLTNGGGHKRKSIEELPDRSLICNCNFVRKGQIMQAIQEGKLTTIDEIRKVTKAAVSCGTCVASVTELLTFALK